jgi:hypothetical protein
MKHTPTMSPQGCICQYFLFYPSELLVDNSYIFVKRKINCGTETKMVDNCICCPVCGVPYMCQNTGSSEDNTLAERINILFNEAYNRWDLLQNFQQLIKVSLFHHIIMTLKNKIASKQHRSQNTGFFHVGTYENISYTKKLMI